MSLQPDTMTLYSPIPMTTIQIRVDKKTKQQAAKIFDKLGLDMSSAVRIYLHQVALRKGLPFLSLTENGLTTEQEQQIIHAAQEARDGKNVSRGLKGAEAINYLAARVWK